MQNVQCILGLPGVICGDWLADEFSAAGYLCEKDDLIYHPPLGLSIMTDATQEQAQVIVDAHDPVFITAARADDTVTVTISKLNNVDGATDLLLTVDDTPLPEATPLINNAATVLIESPDEITIGIVESYPHQEVTI